MNGSEDVDFDFFDTPRNEGTESSAIYTQSGGASAKPPRGSKHVASNSEEKRHAKEIDNSPRKGGRNEDRRSDDDYSSDSSSSFESDSETPRMKRAPANTANRKDKQVSRGRMLPESPESSSAYSDSGSESADNFYDEEKGHGDHPREKINVTLPKTVQAWGSEEKHNKDKRHESHKEQEKGENYKQSSTKKRRDHKEEKYSNRKGNSESDSDSSVESKSKEKFGKRRTKVRNGPEKSDQNKRQPLKSASSSHSNNSDITDVSPLESPDVSPREARKRYDNVQYGAKVTSKPDVDIQLETDKIDLSILMKCMADIDREKQQRLKANSRRVMFAPPSHNDKPKPNYTFSSSRARMIEKENQRLLQQIMHHVQPGSKKLKPGSATKPLPKKAVEPVIQRLTPSAVNRQRHQRKIEMENMQILKRLQTVRPTRGMSRVEQLDEFDRQASYGLPTCIIPTNTREFDETMPYRETHSQMKGTVSTGQTQRSRPSSAKSNLSTTGRRSRPSSAKSNASIRSNASVRSNMSIRSGTSTGRQKKDVRPPWDDRFSYS